MEVGVCVFGWESPALVAETTAFTSERWTGRLYRRWAQCQRRSPQIHAPHHAEARYRRLER